ncbi:MAG: hypothetical protein ACE15C_15785 [Phycisphaerae bacterium]
MSDPVEMQKMSPSPEDVVLLNDGKLYRRIRCGAPEEGGGWGAEEGRECHDWGAKPGDLHAPGCDVERCPRCGNQLFICGWRHRRSQALSSMN